MSSPPSAPAPVRAGAAALFGTVARLRRNRSLHPNGVAYRATIEIDERPAADLPSADLLKPGARHPAVVRFSRSIGLPERVPDILGIALRAVDAYGDAHHQDLLMVTSGLRPVTRHILLPGRSYFGDAHFSTLLPYRIGGRGPLLVGAAALGEPATGANTAAAIAQLVATAEQGRLSFRLDLAELRGPWRSFGRFHVEERLVGEPAAKLRFNPPVHTGGGFEPVGPFQGLRDPAYRGSQAGWPHD